MSQLRIRDERSQIVPLRFSDSQEILWKYVAPVLDSPDGKLWFIVLKGRQVYASTFFEALTFARTMESGNTNSLVIAQDLDSSTSIFQMVKRFYDHLALPKIRPPKTKELVIPLREGPSYFKVISAGTAAKGRGTTQTCVHCSEVAFWPHAEVMTGLFQAMPYVHNTLWVVESTANGVEGHGEMFYRMWKDAVCGRSKMVPIFIPWFLMPKYRDPELVEPDDWDEEERLLIEKFSKYGLDGHSLHWRRWMIATKLHGFTEMFHQEYPSFPEEAFISTGLPAFDSLAILKQQDNVRPAKLRGVMEDGKFRADQRGEVFLWSLPLEGRQYCIGVDTAEGIRGGDFACAQILRCDTMEQVGIVHGLIQPYEFAKTLNDIGRWYNNAILNVEVNNTGHAVQDFLIRKWQYPRLHPWRGKPDRITTETRLWGWETNSYSRPLLIEAGRRAINTGLCTLHDSATLGEIRNFSRADNGLYGALGGHDDRVLALLLALRSREENYMGGPTYIEVPISDPDFKGRRVIDMSRPRRMRDVKKTSRKAEREAAFGRAQEGVRKWMQL